jgi:glycogen debranching enzyme
MISLIGASAYTGLFRKVFSSSLSTLAKHQSRKGQIPNDVDIFVEGRPKNVTFATIDSSLWFILGEFFYKKRFGQALWTEHKNNIGKAMKWVEFQDAGEDLLPEQQPTSDWMDCFPHKYGHTINTQALCYAAFLALGRKKDAAAMQKMADMLLWDKKLGYFLPWRWKGHDGYVEKEEWFDSLGNMLAIIFGLATEKQAESILDFAEKKGVAKPYPMRNIYPAIKKGAAGWHDYFRSSLAAKPHSYLNGGIWPFVGGFYVCALAEAGRGEAASAVLTSLAEANSLGKRYSWDFNEWLHPVRGTAEGGRHQSWSAGGYLLAYEAVRSGKNPLKVNL